MRVPKKKSKRRVSGNPAKAAEQRATRPGPSSFAGGQPVFSRGLREALGLDGPGEIFAAPRWPTPEDWAELERRAHAQYPMCPDCGAAMKVFDNDGEEGGDDAGNTVISTLIHCSAYWQAEEEDREPAPHLKLEHGWADVELTLYDEG